MGKIYIELTETNAPLLSLMFPGKVTELRNKIIIEINPSKLGRFKKIIKHFNSIDEILSRHTGMRPGSYNLGELFKELKNYGMLKNYPALQKETNGYSNK